VSRVFVDLYKKGLIYRGADGELVPASMTALSDEEVVMKGAERRALLFQGRGGRGPGRFLTIATTAPGDDPGDTAVA